jgi:hypothetical protein
LRTWHKQIHTYIKIEERKEEHEILLLFLFYKRKSEEKNGDGIIFLSKAKLCNLTRLILHLLANLVRGPPAQLDGFDPLVLVAGVPDVDFLGDAAALLGGEGTACLGFELEFVALYEVKTKVSL